MAMAMSMDGPGGCGCDEHSSKDVVGGSTSRSGIPVPKQSAVSPRGQEGGWSQAIDGLRPDRYSDCPVARRVGWAVIMLLVRNSGSKITEPKSVAVVFAGAAVCVWLRLRLSVS